MVGRVLVVVVVVAVLSALVLRRRRRGGGSERLADLLAYAAVAASLLTGAITYSIAGDDMDTPALAVTILATPVVISLAAACVGRLAPSAAATVRWVSAGALLVFVAVSGLSVGAFFAPSALLLLAASVAQTAAAPRRS